MDGEPSKHQFGSNLFFFIRPEVSPFWLVSDSDLGKGCIDRPLSLLFVHS